MKYWVDNVWKIPKTINKRRQTNKEKYWVINYTQTQEWKNEQKRLSFEKYWVDSYTQTEECKERTREICLEKYWVDSYTKTKECTEKREKTCLYKYGSTSFLWTEKYKTQQLQKFYNSLCKKIETLVSHNISFEEYSLKLAESKYHFICKACSTKFEDYLSYNWLPQCPICFPYRETKAEKQLKDLLTTLQLDTERNTRKIIYPFELDIYLSSNNLAIEYNWLMRHSIWKSTSSSFNNYELRDDLKYYHLNKTNLCEEKWIELLHIQEDEWLDSQKQEIWKEHIKFKLWLLEKSFYTLKEILKRTYYIEVLQGDKLKVDKRYSNWKELIDLGYKIVDTLDVKWYKFTENTFELKDYNDDELWEKERIIYNCWYLILEKE